MYRVIPTAHFFVREGELLTPVLVVEFFDESAFKRLAAMRCASGWISFRGALPTGRLLTQEGGENRVKPDMAAWLDKQSTIPSGSPAFTTGRDWARINNMLLLNGALDG
jgi:hypothetical protein